MITERCQGLSNLFYRNGKDEYNEIIITNIFSLSFSHEEFVRGHYKMKARVFSVGKWCTSHGYAHEQFPRNKINCYIASRCRQEALQRLSRYLTKAHSFLLLKVFKYKDVHLANIIFIYAIRIIIFHRGKLRNVLSYHITDHTIITTIQRN